MGGGDAGLAGEAIGVGRGSLSSGSASGPLGARASLPWWMV